MDTAPVAAVDPPYGVDPHCLRRVIPVVGIEARDRVLGPVPWERDAVARQNGGQYARNRECAGHNHGQRHRTGRVRSRQHLGIILRT